MFYSLPLHLRNQNYVASHRSSLVRKHQILAIKTLDDRPNGEVTSADILDHPSYGTKGDNSVKVVQRTSTNTKSIPFSPESSLLKQHQLCDVIESNKIISSYVRAGDLDSAICVFQNMKVKTTITWNSILAGYAKKPGKIKEAQELFEKIPEPDTVSYNILLACYWLNFDIGKACALFDNMPVKDAASWNTMISGYAQMGKMSEARELFSEMPEKNSVSWSAMVSGYVACGDLYSALEIFNSATIKSVVAWTAMITGYMKFGRVQSAERLFQVMPLKNLVTWNAMIAGYIENNRAEDGLKLFRKMLEAGFKANASSLSSVLLGCSTLSALQLGKQVHQFICKSPLVSDTTVGTSLVSMYSKCGDLNDAWKLFVQIPQRDIVTWNAMISGYAQHGAGEKAVHLFYDMKRDGIQPDCITFIAVLLACNHSGLVDLGVHYFESMANDFGVEAKLDHYTCMVDLLGRAGRLSEAVCLIKNMPFEGSDGFMKAQFPFDFPAHG